MQRIRTLAAAAFAVASVLLAACGGGGGGSPLPHTSATPTPAATATATPTPAPVPTPAAQSNSGTLTVSSTAPATTTLPATGGITASVTVPQVASGSGNIAVTVATGADATMSRVHHLTRYAMPGGGYVFQMDFVPSATMTFNAAPSFSLDVTQWVTGSGLSVSQAAAYLQGVNVYAGIVDGAGNFNVVGPLTINATSTAITVSYTGPQIALTLQANQHYTIGIHLGPIAAATSTPAPTSSPSVAPSPTATPTPAPTAAPTATPTPTPTPTPTATPTAPASTMTVTPTSLEFPTQSGPVYSFDPQDINISGGVAPYTVDGYDNTIISVQANSNGYGYSSSFTVTPLKGGTTTITVHDSSGQTATVSVGVTSASGVVQ